MDKHEIRLWSQTTGNININNCRRGTIFKYDVWGLSGRWKFRFWKSHNLESHNVSLVFKFSWRGSISHGFILLNLFTCLFICLFVTLKADKTFTYMWLRQFRCLTHSIFAYDNPYRIYWGTLCLTKANDSELKHNYLTNCTNQNPWEADNASVKNSPTFYGHRRIVILLTKSRQWTLSWAS